MGSAEQTDTAQIDKGQGDEGQIGERQPDKPPIAATITLDNLRSARPWDDDPVTEVEIVDQKAEVERFLSLVLPGQKIEKLVRATMAFRARRPSSLFFQTVHQAYAEHHALGIRPEVLMFLINNVVAETVKAHSEKYRHLFTSSSERKIVRVDHDGLRLGQDSPWHEAIGMFEQAMREIVPAGIMEHMLPKLSTSTVEAELASLISFMDAASPFYDYRVRTRCGIPRIVLFGAAEDYAKIVSATAMLAEVFSDDLAPYFDNLLPVLQTIASAAAGQSVDEDFWSQIYKHYNGSGGPHFNGWITSFLWYVNEIDHRTGEKRLKVKRGPYKWQDMRGGSGALSSGCEPSHVAAVPFIWEYFGKEITMSFAAGVLGVDIEQGALVPQLSYAVLHRKAP